jgi:flagellar biosynthesis/type III secretory pathway protein FliH
MVDKEIKKKFMKARAKTKKEAEDIEENFAEGGLAEATAKLKAKGMKEGGMVVKDKTVAIDKSPNSGLITTKGFGASRRT